MKNIRNPEAYGALDLGSNNCRLLVAQRDVSGFKVIDSFSQIVRLGEGVSRSGILSDRAIDRTFDALKTCKKKIERNKVSHFRAVVTAACRQASNSQQFIDHVFIELGIKLEIIDSQEESSLALEGCSSLLCSSVSNALIFDIGGCSTELIWVSLSELERPRIINWISLECGVVSLVEQYGTDNSSRGNYPKMVEDAARLMTKFFDQIKMSDLDYKNGVQVIGTSGTATTIAALHLGLERYDRTKVDGLFLGRHDICLQVNRLLALSDEERSAMGSIGIGRGDVVIAGCAILEAIFRFCPIDTIRVADRGLREGILLELMRADIV